MNIRDFFILFIRCFAVAFMVTDLIDFAPWFILEFQKLDSTTWLGFLMNGIIYLAIFFFLIIKTPYLVDLLKLNEGFKNESVEFKNVTPKKLVSISIVLLGVFLLFTSATKATSLFYYWFGESVPKNGGYLNDNELGLLTFDKVELLASTLNVILGILMIRYNRWFTAKIFGFVIDKDGDPDNFFQNDEPETQIEE